MFGVMALHTFMGLGLIFGSRFRVWGSGPRILGSIDLKFLAFVLVLIEGSARRPPEL